MLKTASFFIQIPIKQALTSSKTRSKFLPPRNRSGFLVYYKSMNNIIKGSVVVIRDKRDYLNIKKGTILVSRNTHPDIVIVINNVKAIVTEVDNKLCHAAIIAREFNKPLLMGVNNAVRDFTTGDEVVVDLDSKVIKKTK